VGVCVGMFCVVCEVCVCLCVCGEGRRARAYKLVDSALTNLK